ncbi:MAG: hypothetical protein ACRDK3_00245 [Actinomycetota bacterium]
MRRTAVVGFVLLLGLVVAACGDPDSADDGSGGSGAPPAAPDDPDSPVSSSPDPPGGDLGDPKGMRVSAQEGLVDVSPQRFEKATPSKSGDALEIYFWHGIEECYGVDRVHIEYEASEVTVRLFTGRNPEAEVCTEQAVYKVYLVELDEPLKGRQISDGAK